MRRTTCATVAGALAVGFLSGVMFTSTATQPSVVASLSAHLSLPTAAATPAAHSPYALVSQFSRVLVLVENEYVDAVDRARLIEGAIKGLVSELDPHSSYLEQADYATFKGDTQGEFGGVGIEVDFRNDTVTVMAPIEGSPADRAGILPGDAIVSINRRSVQGRTMDDLVKLMRGPAKTSVDLSIRRRGRTGLLHFTLIREVIEVASVASKALRDSIVYVRVKQFQRGTHIELLQALGELQLELNGAIGGAILDLRNNPGGLVSEAVAVADEFLTQGGIYATRKRNTVVDEVFATDGEALPHVPLVVLVNEFSASAAELVAGALQDNLRATVIGANTFGKGSVQAIIDLPNGAGLRLTTLRYYTPSGHAIQAHGITPDVVVEATYAEDPGYSVLREQDLENHLPAEQQAQPTAPSPANPKAKRAPEQSGVSPTHFGVARIVPFDPTNGPDVALSIGYQLVRSVLDKSKSLPKR
jgi:carboxyl-terminal processing protease